MLLRDGFVKFQAIYCLNPWLDFKVDGNKIVILDQKVRNRAGMGQVNHHLYHGYKDPKHYIDKEIVATYGDSLRRLGGL